MSNLLRLQLNMSNMQLRLCLSFYGPYNQANVAAINVGDNIKTLIQKLLQNLIPETAQMYNVYQVEQRRQCVNLIAQIADIYPVELC